MRHRISGKKIGRDDSHRKALLKNMVISLVEHGSVTTTLIKAKYVKPFFEKLLTKARVNNQQTVRELRSKIGSEKTVRKLINDIAPKFAKRPGGYTRIIKLANRGGDNAPMAKLEIIEIKEVKEVKAESEAKTAKASKPRVRVAKKKNEEKTEAKTN